MKLALSISENMSTFTPPVDSDEEEEEARRTDESTSTLGSSEAVDLLGIPGWSRQ